LKIPIKTQKGTINITERLKELNRTENCAVLATLNNGHPYTSLVNFAFTPDYRAVLFATPKATSKYRNILKMQSVALLIDNRTKSAQNLMDLEAVTILGTAHPVKRGNRWEDLAKIYIEKHPILEEFVRSPTTALIIVNIKRCIHVSKFQSISVWDAQA